MYDAHIFFFGREGEGGETGICALTKLDWGDARRLCVSIIIAARATKKETLRLLLSLSRLIYSILLPNPVYMNAGNQFPTPLLHPFRAAAIYYPASMADRNKRVIDKYDDPSPPPPPPRVYVDDVRGHAQTRKRDSPRGSIFSIFCRRQKR